MPTGYTADVQSGKITDFATFALQCARAFGALVSMRDDGMDAPIPERIEPDSYHAKEFISATERVADLIRMTSSEIQEAAAKANANELASWEKRQHDKRDQRARYNAMLEKAAAWTPPTADHLKLKEFMLQQLQQSIDWDCRGYPDPKPDSLSASEWHWRQLAEAGRDIAYHDEEHRKDVKRAAERNQWLRDLRASLDQPRGLSAAETPNSVEGVNND